MTILIDTHAILWFTLNEPKLSMTARSAIEDVNHRVLLSPASYWEIAIKISVGRYRLNTPFEEFWRQAINDAGAEILGIEPRHTAKLINLPYHHKDPFDRLLVAQAIVEQVPIVSSDTSLDAYGIRRIW